jgi:outer membrane receptor protein involved in Fe transport
MEVNKPIIYTSDITTGGDGYFNGTKISTAGLETELRWDRPKFSTSLSYSYYRAVDNDIDYLRGDSDQFLAAPSHKVTLTETWHITKALDWNISGFWLGDRLAYAYPASGVTSLPDEFILNTFVNYKFKHFSAGLGIANLLDQTRYAPQPYAGGSGPFMLTGREIFAKLGFTF